MARQKPEINERAQRLIDAVTAAGSNPSDPRDAAHEACHALDYEVPIGSWEREEIHRYVLDRADERGRASIFAGECFARAVERIVCRDLGYDIGDPSHWVFIAAIEALKSGISSKYEVWDDTINKLESNPLARKMADRILAMAPEV
jgi:hypothetical protein